jgi:hypothetical protein
MPFQPDSSIDTALWRYQTTNSQGSVTSEIYVNLGYVKFMKTTRTPPPVVGGQVPTVAIWYYGNYNVNPDITLEGPAAVAFLADMDTIFT